MGMNQTGNIMNCKNIIALSLTRVPIGIWVAIPFYSLVRCTCAHRVVEMHLSEKPIFGVLSDRIHASQSLPAGGPEVGK